MTTIEFQVESNRVSSAPHVPCTFGEAQAQSVILGLMLRGWLTASEQETLDQAAFEQCLVFMLYNRRYVHPRDIELFPAAALCAGINRDDEAISSQVLPNLGNSDTGCYVVHTSVVNPSCKPPIVIGMLGPVLEELSSNSRERFAVFAEYLKTQFSAIELHAEALKDELASSSPVLLVERSSGRVMAVNREMAALSNKTENELIGSEYGDVQNSLTSRVLKRGMTMTKMDCGVLQIMVVRLGKANRQVSEISPLPGRHMIHKLNNHVTCLLAAASHLESICQLGDPEALEVTKMIQFEAMTLNRQIKRLDIMLNYVAMSTACINISDELQTAIRVTEEIYGENADIQLKPYITPGHCELPEKALSSLVETLLFAHLNSGRQRTTTVLDIAAAENGSDVTIETDFTHSGITAQFHQDWLDCALRVVDLMSPTVQMEQLQTKRKLITRLTIHETETDRA